MADDIFGDDSLFSEFERDREEQNIFINFEQDESGIENRSRIVFRAAESESDMSDDEEGETETRVQNKDATKEEEKSNGEQKSADLGEGATTPEKKEEPADVDSGEQGETSAPQTTAFQDQFESILISMSPCVNCDTDIGLGHALIRIQKKGGKGGKDSS